MVRVWASQLAQQELPELIGWQRSRHIMSTVPLANSSTPRPAFSEVRDAHRQATLAIIATSAVATCATFIALILVAVGVTA